MQRNELNKNILSLNVLQTKTVDISQGPILYPCRSSSTLIGPLFSAIIGSTFRTNCSTIKPKPMPADVFRVDITQYGLPIALIMDGCGVYADPQEIHELASDLMLMLVQLAGELQGTSLTEIDIIKHVKEKYRELDAKLQNHYGSEASFSSSLIYEDNHGHYKSLNIGTGDTMIVHDNDKEIQTIVKAANTIEGAPIPFPSINIKNADIKAALQALQITITDVQPGDRLIFLTDGAYEHLALKSSESSDGLMQYREFTPTICTNRLSIAEIATSALQKINDRYKKESSTGIISIGDDTTIAEVRIPGNNVKNQLAFLVALSDYKERRIQEAEDENVSLEEHYFSLFSQWFVRNTNGSAKISAANDMINALHGRDVVFTADSLNALRNSGVKRTHDNLGLGQIVSIYDSLGALPLSFVTAETLLHPMP